MRYSPYTNRTATFYCAGCQGRTAHAEGFRYWFCVTPAGSHGDICGRNSQEITAAEIDIREHMRVEALKSARGKGERQCQ